MILKWHQRILNVIFLNVFEWDRKSTDSRLSQESELILAKCRNFANFNLLAAMKSFNKSIAIQGVSYVFGRWVWHLNQ